MSLDAMKQALEALERGETQLRYEAIEALRAAIEQAQEPWVRMIKTWQQRCEEHPDHNGIVSEGMIQARMQEEIDELRAATEHAERPQTHSEECWRWHHQCAIAKIEREIK